MGPGTEVGGSALCGVTGTWVVGGAMAHSPRLTRVCEQVAERAEWPVPRAPSAEHPDSVRASPLASLCWDDGEMWGSHVEQTGREQPVCGSWPRPCWCGPPFP